MNTAQVRISTRSIPHPGWFKLGLLAVSAVVLCSCRGVPPTNVMPAVQDPFSASHSNPPAAGVPAPSPQAASQSLSDGKPLVITSGLKSSRPLAARAPVVTESSPTNIAQVAYHAGPGCSDGNCQFPGAQPGPGFHPGLGTQPMDPAMMIAGRDPGLPMSAYTGHPTDGYTIPGIVGEDGDVVQWRPPGISCPWPEDEYVRDGGDRQTPVQVGLDWSVRGLDIEDTVVHFDTLDGNRLVKPSNCVKVYAPRFASVRHVDGVGLYDQREMLVGVAQPLRVHRQDDLQIATTTLQPVQPVGEVGLKGPNIFRERLAGTGLENVLMITGTHNRFLPYEDFAIIRTGQFDQADKPRLAESVDAANVWIEKQAVQVVIDETRVQIDTHSARPQQTLEFELPPGKPCIRLVKVASTCDARPGETVEFTLRYDNVGDELVGNVTLIDNLSPRLEYVPGTARSSRAAEFITERNEVDSLVLRWEITEPLPVGQGGVIRFRCKVR